VGGAGAASAGLSRLFGGGWLVVGGVLLG